MPFFAAPGIYGNSARDLAHKQAHGALINSPALAQDNNGLGLALNGTDEYISLPFARAPLGAIGAVYVECVFTSLPASDGTHVCFSIASNADTLPILRFGASRNSGTSSTWRAEVFANVGGVSADFFRFGNTTVLAQDTLYRLWLVQRADGNGPQIYVNGVAQGITMQSAEDALDNWFADYVATGNTIAIGVIPRATPILYMQGVLYDVRLYSGWAPSASDIADLEVDPYSLYRVRRNISFFLLSPTPYIGRLGQRYTMVVVQQRTARLDQLYELFVAVAKTARADMRYAQLAPEEKTALLDQAYALFTPTAYAALLDQAYTLDTYTQLLGLLQLLYRLDVETVVTPSITAVHYTLTLTGAPDALEDLILPMSSFQVRLRSDTPNFGSVVIPNGTIYADEIEARPNGEIVISRGVRYTDGATEVDEIARVNFETIRLDQGARSNSVTLVGHKTVSPGTPKTVTLQSASYRSESNGVRRFRTELENTIRPGDTASIDGETMTVDSISYTVSARRAVMEIAED